MQQEVFPDAATFLNPLTRQELQQGDTCTCFGFSSSSEAMAHRAGIDLQISPYFNWFYMRGGAVSVEGAIAAANRVGYVPDELYPFAGFPLQLPSLKALQYAGANRNQFAVARVNGRKGLMRAICNGSALITDRYGVSMEHVEACIGYDKAKGFQIQGSGLVTDYWPWGELPIFTQLFRYTKSPFGFIPFPGYIPADDPLFDNGTLLMPTLFEYDAATITGKELLNVEGHISDITGVTWDNELSVDEPMFKVRTKELHLPTLRFNGEVYRGVIATGVIWKYEEQK